MISGAGDVIEPDSGIAAIGSGGPYAQAAAQALAAHTELSARMIAEEAMKIAGRMCIYTNDKVTIEEVGDAGVFLLAGAYGVARSIERSGAPGPLVWGGLALGASAWLVQRRWALTVLETSGDRISGWHSFLDVDAFLRFAAVNSVISNFDGFFAGAIWSS